MEGSSDLGPQDPDDGPFRARVRLHQSWYRATVLGLPHGDEPDGASGRPLGNLLTREDAARGANFLDPAIFEEARRRMRAGPGIDAFRCLADLLSSQALCFNLFGPLVEATDLATTLLRTVLPDLRRVIEVHIEHAPSPRAEYLGDRSAFDVFVGYERTDGTRAFVGVEASLGDGLEGPAYDSPRARELAAAPGAPWLAGHEEQLASARQSRLWRAHLLVEALRRHPAEPYDDGRFAVVYHPADLQAAELVREYRQHLCDPAESFAEWPLDTLLEHWGSTDAGASRTEWLPRCAARYLDLDRSASAEADTGRATRSEAGQPAMTQAPGREAPAVT